MTQSVKSSMEQVIYEDLKQAILKRKLRPGTQLLETTISERLQVSRTPIRAALRRLAQEGLIDLVPNRGAFVIQPSQEEIQEAYQMRARLELMGLELGAGQFTEADFQRMEHACQDEVAALERGDMLAYLAANKLFHQLLVSRSGNRFLVGMTDQLLEKTNIYVMLYDLFYDRQYHATTDPIPAGAQQHRAILAALRAGNIDQASKRLEEHVVQSVAELKTTRPGYLGLDELWRDSSNANNALPTS
ncbi:GntR family transcriptional regulator [Paenibacillus hodogayensis]|uniref:GntR family transcriptional regulator n=1 Tax=Paenibacillus hodogayensis TaxID=279208 RepID=A0ABV5VPY4_9BACL